MADPLILFDKNDMVLELSKLRDSIVNPSGGAGGVFLNTATVEIITLFDETGAVVDISPDSLPLALTYVAASDGIYRVTLADSYKFILGQCHKATVRASSGPGLRGEWVLPIESRTREE